MSDIKDQILELKKARNAVILAHYYVKEEIQEIADFVGDSLGLTLMASKTDADVIVFCGVHFMAETAKMLNQQKTVLLPDMDAGCPMAEMASAGGLKRLKDKHPGAVVVTYVNSTAEVKALSDICCTSSNALKIVQSIPADKEIIFVPDKHLGSYISGLTGRAMILWEGFCPVHQKMDVDHITALKQNNPGAVFVVHPEADSEIKDVADFAGSTEQILNYCKSTDHKNIIIGTESGIFYQLKKNSPDKNFIPASDNLTCPNMKKNTLLKLKACLEDLSPQIEMTPEMAQAAVKPITAMLEIR